MNVILFSEKDIVAPATIRLSDYRFQHIQTVLKAHTGDMLKVGLIGGLMGVALIESMDTNSVMLTVQLNKKPPEKLPLTLIIALPRPKMARRIIRAATELGVAELIFINSYRVEKSYWQSPLITPENIDAYLIEGLEQAKDTVLPAVSFYKRFKPFVEDELPSLMTNKLAYVAHPSSQLACPTTVEKPTVVAIGPEGGFIDYEVKKLLETGFKAMHLGPRILKVESAIHVIATKLFTNIAF